MKQTSVHRGFLDSNQCTYLLDFALSNFEIDQRTYRNNWHARTNRNNNFQKEVHRLLSPISPYSTFYITWINLTEYENSRELPLHLDERSDFTFTIVLTDKFRGGDFIVGQEKFTLNLGDCIAFNGRKHLHGLEPVTEGYRAALNIWIKEGRTPII